MSNNILLTLEIDTVYSPEDRRIELQNPINDALGVEGRLLFSMPTHSVGKNGGIVWDSVKFNVSLRRFNGIKLLKSILLELGLLHISRLRVNTIEYDLFHPYLARTLLITPVIENSIFRFQMLNNHMSPDKFDETLFQIKERLKSKKADLKVRRAKCLVDEDSPFKGVCVDVDLKNESFKNHLIDSLMELKLKDSFRLSFSDSNYDFLKFSHYRA